MKISHGRHDDVIICNDVIYIFVRFIIMNRLQALC